MSGKTTNLEIVHEKAPEANKGELTSIATEGDRTLFFDFMPLDLGNIAGMRTKFQLYTVPGQVYYNSTRKLVLQGVDGIVFVADSQASMREENIESFDNLRQNLAEYGKSLDDISIVLQYNKRDLPNAMSEEELNQTLDPEGKYTKFNAVATTGEGVFPTLKSLAGLVLESLNRDRRRGPAPAAAPRAAPVGEDLSPTEAPARPAAAAPAPATTAVAEASDDEPASGRRPTARATPTREKRSARERAPARSASPSPRARPSPKLQKVVLEEDRSSLLMIGVLMLIILAAAGVILVSFNVV
jgi:signal recognition particle receptor subunit beta